MSRMQQTCDINGRALLYFIYNGIFENDLINAI